MSRRGRKRDIGNWGRGDKFYHNFHEKLVKSNDVLALKKWTGPKKLNWLKTIITTNTKIKAEHMHKAN